MKKEYKRRSFAPGALEAPLPPAMVTVGDFEKANVLTVAWTGILATHPPRTYVSVRPSRHSYGILKEKGEFVINLPSVELARTVDFVGIYTGAKVDKFEKCGLTKKQSEKVAPPTIAECPIALECRVAEVLPMGTHDVFVADIVSVSCDERIVDDVGKMHFELANLLAYSHGEYYALGERVGRFGFSTDKEKPKEEKKRPFYLDAPRGKNTPRKIEDKNRGKRRGSKK
jgi:flavin reductase (DIM6/NTAB) family NADH-FMN oxidoreductase RutF